VPKSVVLDIDEFQQNKTKEIIADLKFPLVIKPIEDSAQGRDVLCNIQNFEQLIIFLSKYFLSYHYALIEEFHGKLKSYRVLVFNRRILGIVLRQPASVIGDGTLNIEELINENNVRRKETYEFLGPIVLDDECQIRLKELGISADYIPAYGEEIVLCYTSNATRGGTYKSLGKQICKENRRLLVRVATVLNLGIAGIDVECKDINHPIEPSNGVIIEVNQRPSIRIHELPISGSAHFVTKEIMRSFIYRHPLSYLRALYSNKPTGFYIRTSLLISILGIIFFLATSASPHLN
jgi:D-alanine-D-alanine ligase-like ATP-grasp enzyme